MIEEFKKIKSNGETRFVLEFSDAGVTGSTSIASVEQSIGELQSRTEPSKPRNFVAKNAKMGGAGKMKDKSKTIPRKEKHKKPVAEGVSDLSYDAQSLITKLRRDVEEKRLQPTPQAVLAAARELAGDMDFAPQLLVKQVLGQGIAEKIDSRFRKTEWIPIPDALKILKHYGATIEEWGGHFHFAYYDREGVRKRIEDLTWNADDTRNVRLSILNQAVRELKAQQQGMAEGFNGEYDDEAGMAHTNLLTSARAVMGLLKTIEDKDNLPEWVQEKIAKAEMMLVGVWDYLQSQKEQGIDPQVEGFGKMRGSSSAYDRDYASSVSGMGRGPDHRGLGQELAHETNNYAVAIDGKTWKVFADQRQAENIARSLKAKGKNATVHPTGENPSESADPYFESLRAKVEELAKK